MQKYLIIITLLFATLLSSFAARADDRIRNANFFVTVGRTYVEIEGEKEDASALKVGGGYRFSDYAGFEFLYIYYGRISERVDVGNTNTLKSSAFVFNGIATFPINPLFDLYFKIGISEWDAELQFQNITFESNGSDPVYTLGFGYNIDYDSTIRFEYELSEYDDAQFSVISFGFQHNF